MAKRKITPVSQLAGFQYLNIPFVSIMELTNKTFVITRMEIIPPKAGTDNDKTAYRITGFVDNEDDLFQTISASYLFANLYNIIPDVDDCAVEITLESEGKNYTIR